MNKTTSALVVLLCVAPTYATSQPAPGGQCTTVVECAQAAMQAADRAVTALKVAAPAGSVMSFQADSCPAGWQPFVAAQGRFIRGADPTGEVDPDRDREIGSVQEDALQGHAHRSEAAGGSIGIYDSAQGTGPLFRSAAASYSNRRVLLIQGPSNLRGYGSVRIAGETRPKNVALLYCIREEE